MEKSINPTLSVNSADEHGPKNATNFKVYIDLKCFMLPCFVSVHLYLCLDYKKSQHQYTNVNR